MNQLENIQEELFCIHYETKTFAAYVNYHRLERWIPGFSDKVTEESHLLRYKFASQFTTGKNVLDMAAGSGTGSYMLATIGHAKNVTGIDIDADAIRYAKHRNKNEKVTYQLADATQYVNENFFDVIISFETIEHLPDYENYLININKSLKSDGLFMVSTPISEFEIDNKPTNEFHAREWGLQSFQKEITKFLSIKKVYYQLYPYRDNSIFSRVIKRITKTPPVNYFSNIYDSADLPAAIKVADIGNKIKGYQILLCEKK